VDAHRFLTSILNWSDTPKEYGSHKSAPNKVQIAPRTSPNNKDVVGALTPAPKKLGQVYRKRYFGRVQPSLMSNCSRTQFPLTSPSLAAPIRQQHKNPSRIFPASFRLCCRNAACVTLRVCIRITITRNAFSPRCVCVGAALSLRHLVLSVHLQRHVSSCCVATTAQSAYRPCTRSKSTNFAPRPRRYPPPSGSIVAASFFPVVFVLSIISCTKRNRNELFRSPTTSDTSTTNKVKGKLELLRETIISTKAPF
jgi:hypothetical protein